MATVEGADPDQLLEEVQAARDEQLADARELFDWFADKVNGTELTRDDLPTGPNMSIDEAATWREARGDSQAATQLRTIQSRLGI